MKRLSLLCAVLLAFAAPAFAVTVKVPGSTGRLLNHTSLPSEAFRVSFSVSCTDLHFSDCGRFEMEKNLNPDGTYEVPAFELDAGNTQPAKRLYSLHVFFSLPEEDPRFPKGAAPGDLASLVQERRVRDVTTLVAPSFTVLMADAGPLDVKLASGRKLDSFLREDGRDLGVTIQLDFGLTGTENFETTVTLEQTGFSRKRWVDLPRTYFTLRGEYAADAPFDYEVTFRYQDVKTGRANFRADLVNVLGALKIDDVVGAADQLPAERRLTGSFPDTYFDLDYPKREEYEFADIGFSYATLNAECVNGKIQGELIYRDGQFTSDPETSRVAVTGTCRGETGELRWPIQKKSGGTEMLSAKYVRIRAQEHERPNGRKSISRLLMTDDVSEMLGVYKGEELSMFMAVYASDGSYAGKLSVSTD